METAERSDLRSARFRREREASWRELDHILGQIRRRGFGSLTSEQLHRLPGLYRGAVSSLSVARAISLDRNLLEYLEGLVSRAYVLVYTDKRPPRDVIAEFFRWRWPRAVSDFRRSLLAAFAILMLGAGCGFVLTLADEERYVSFVPETMSQGRTPESTTESLRDVIFPPPGEEQGGLSAFAGFLFAHNARIGIMCFALGFVAGVPVVILLFYNGLVLGAMTALYASRGLGFEFLGWVMGHGVTELAAVCLCGAAGLALARGMLFPGTWTRLRSLAEAGRSAAPVMIGAVVMFLVAGLIEGYLRQLVTLTSLRWLIAAVTFVFWGWYFFLHGPRQPRWGDAA